MEPIDWKQFRFSRREPPEMKFIPWADDDPPPLENRYRLPALLFAIAAGGLSLLLFLAG